MEMCTHIVTNEIYSAYLQCPYKAILRSNGTSPTTSDFYELERTLHCEFANRALQKLHGPKSTDVVSRAPISLEQAFKSFYPIILDATGYSGSLSVHFDALVHFRTKFFQGYIPVLFVQRDKISKNNKMSLAFNGLFLRSIGLKKPREGKIIFGSDLSTAKVHLAELIPTVEQDLVNITTLITDQDDREFCLNRHCSSCEYDSHCRTLAQERDDLSLLRMLKKADIVKLNAKGIFTTKQLAYTFRPRRSRKKHGKDRQAKHDPSLQALAAHSDTIYVAEKPAIPERKLCVSLDIEGIPDRNFYYLIGLTVVRDDCRRSYSLWAEERDDERNIWRSFLEIMETIGDCTIFHYGIYDHKGLQRLHQIYGGNVALVKRILSSCSNVIQLIDGKVYFPTFSNDLKTVASSIGFRWAVENSSGIQSLVWRYRWEATLKHEYKKHLLAYNRDDCRALEVVVDALHSLGQSTDARSSGILKFTTDVEVLERA